MKSSIGLLVLLTAIGCARNKETDYTGAQVCPADTMAEVSFSGAVIPILAANCATSGCHDAVTHESGLSLDAAHAYYTLVTSGRGYIDTVNPSESMIIVKMNDKVSPMPPSGILDSCTRKVILKWIAQKAKNN